MQIKNSVYIINIGGVTILTNLISQIGLLQEDTDFFSSFSDDEQNFIEEVLSFPIKYPSIKQLENLRETYLQEYINDPDAVESIMPLDEFIEYYDESKDRIICEDNQGKQEFTEEELIENGFYPSDFIIHEHDATKLHWDLRWKTRFGNSAYSFAIPKCKLPESQDEKVLALRQPMHPSIWVDLKATDTFRDENSKGPMGKISLVDRGRIFAKETPKSFIIYLMGEKIKGGFILVHVGKENSYMLMQNTNILSDKDARRKEWRITAFHTFKYQKQKVTELFGIDTEDCKLVFENNDGSIEASTDDQDELAVNYILVPSEKSIADRRKANPERIPMQCQADAIGTGFGDFIWSANLTEDKRTECYNALRRIDFNTKYLTETHKTTQQDLFSEAISCILTGRKMFKSSNLELILIAIIKPKKEN